MISTYLSQVADFHRAFRHPIHEHPELNDAQINALRPALIAEELHELRKAIDDNDRLGQLDALCDIQYVLSGAVLAWGLRELFDAPTIMLRFAKIHDMDAHIAEMFGLNAMMEIYVESRSSVAVAMNLRELQSHLSQLVWSLEFAWVFDAAFGQVHENNMGKLWNQDQLNSWLYSMQLTDTLSFETTKGGYIARDASGKIRKPPGFVKVSLERFV